MAIDISGITIPSLVGAGFDPDNPTKWTEELSLFYLRVFKEVQDNNEGELQDFSGIATPLEGLSETLAGTDSEKTEFNSFYGAIDTEISSLLDNFQTNHPDEYAALPSTIKDGLPQINIGTGFIGWIMLAIRAYLLYVRIKAIIDSYTRSGEQGSNDELVEKMEEIRALLEHALLIQNPSDPEEFFSVLEQISQREQKITLEDPSGGGRISIYPHTLSVEYEDIEW